MAAVAGILGQELLGVTPVWFEAGTKEYIFPTTTLTAIEFLTLGALELKRYRGWKEHKTARPLIRSTFLPRTQQDCICMILRQHHVLIPRQQNALISCQIGSYREAGFHEHAPLLVSSQAVDLVAIVGMLDID